MWLVDSVCVVVAELVHNLRDLAVVLRGECIANEALELECAALALVVDLVAERFSDVGVHVDEVYRKRLHWYGVLFHPAGERGPVEARKARFTGR
jgi:Ran GTPase-activating protein (RanGAP) involved in mRNA processing and transport